MIISNTTPLINFAEIGCLELLFEMFGPITVPPAVVTELGEKAATFPKAAMVASDHRIKNCNPKDTLLVRSLVGNLHRGEAECLALAMENPGSLLILDELAAREVAKCNGLLFVGTIGCLIEAKSSGLISQVKPYLSEIRHSARFWISDELMNAVLRDAGEL